MEIATIKDNQTCKTLLEEITEVLEDRVVSGVWHLLRLSRFEPDTALKELGLGNLLVLLSLRALSDGDTLLLAAVSEVYRAYAPLDSRHLASWIEEDYDIPQDLLERAVRQATRLRGNPDIQGPPAILQNILHLSESHLTEEQQSQTVMEIATIKDNQTCKTLLEEITEVLEDRVVSGVWHLLRLSRFEPDTALKELGLGNLLVLLSLRALSDGDTLLLAAVSEVYRAYAPLDSRHLASWIEEDYDIPQDLLERAVRQATRLRGNPDIQVPPAILQNILHLSESHLTEAQQSQTVMEIATIKDNQTCKTLLEEITEVLEDRVVSGVWHLLRLSRFEPDTALKELGLGNLLVLLSLRALSDGDTLLLAAVSEVYRAYAPLDSRHLASWIEEDYDIPQDLLERAVRQATRLRGNPDIQVPPAILQNILHLSESHLTEAQQSQVALNVMDPEEMVSRSQTGQANDPDGLEESVGDETEVNAPSNDEESAQHLEIKEGKEPAEARIEEPEGLETKQGEALQSNDCDVLEEPDVDGVEVNTPSNDEESAQHQEIKEGKESAEARIEKPEGLETKQGEALQSNDRDVLEEPDGDGVEVKSSPYNDESAQHQALNERKKSFEVSIEEPEGLGATKVEALQFNDCDVLEEPDGDGVEVKSPPYNEESAQHQAINERKKSVEVSIEEPEGLEAKKVEALQSEDQKVKGRKESPKRFVELQLRKGPKRLKAKRVNSVLSTDNVGVVEPLESKNNEANTRPSEETMEVKENKTESLEEQSLMDVGCEDTEHHVVEGGGRCSLPTDEEPLLYQANEESSEDYVELEEEEPKAKRVNDELSDDREVVGQEPEGNENNSDSFKPDSLAHLPDKKDWIIKAVREGLKDSNGMTILHHVIQLNSSDLVGSLLNTGAKITATFNGGQTYLMYAISSGSISAAKTLLSRGAQVDELNDKGESALFVAVKYQEWCPREEVARDRKSLSSISTAAIRLLSEYNANFNLKNSDGDTPLHVAARVADCSVIETLLKNGADPNAKNSKLQTALHIAVEANSLASSEESARSKVDLNCKNETGESHLHIENSTAFNDILDVLLKYKGVIEVVDIEGYTPLCVAAEKGRTEIVKTLASKGANVNRRVNNGTSVIFCAASNSNYDCFIALRTLGAVCSYTDLRRVIENNDVKMMDLLKDNHAVDVNTKDSSGNSILHWAASTGKAAGVSWLLACGMDVNDKDGSDWTPLHYAVCYGHFPVVRLLLRRGAVVNCRNVDGNTALHWAARAGNEEAVSCLLDSGADINSKGYWGWTPLQWAAGNGHTSVVKVLVDRGADIQSRDRDGNTALHWAARTGKMEAVSWLLDSGADINAIGLNKWTAFHRAAEKGHIHVVKLLYDRGANANCLDKDGNTALHLAARAGKEDVVSWLLDCGLDVNIPNKSGWTPLHWAALKGHLPIVKFLVTRGADVSCRNKYGNSPLNLAVRAARDKTVSWLLDSNLEINS